MTGFNESAAPNIGALLLDIARPDGQHARLAVLLGSIDNGRLRLIRASRNDYTPAQIASIAVEEFAKVANAAEAYRIALGLHDPIEGVR